MRTALFIGRFQPFHMGHLQVVDFLCEKYDLVKIAIGSSEKSYEKKNPFSDAERRQMIRKSAAGRKYRIYSVPDFLSDEEWVNHLMDIVGDFDIAYTGNGVVKRLLKRRDFIVYDIRRRMRISSTVIRRRIAESKDVANYLPKGTIIVLEKIEGAKRIRSIKDA